MVGSNTRADVFIFNGSSLTANVAVHILDRDGTNLAGATVPGSTPTETYPGETGATTVALLSAHTRIFTFSMPQTSGPGLDGVTNVSTVVRVISDQPIAVGSDFQFSGFHSVPCSLLPK